jgi:intracellular multiplication protein IcmJ
LSYYLRSINLRVNPGAWAYYAKRNADDRFASYKKSVALECNDTCQFCGFKDKSHMQVVNLDGNYKNNKISNMVLACPLCSQCFFIEMIGKVENTGAVLIYLPHMTQQNLNGLCHALFCAILNGTKYAQVAQSTYNDLRLLSKVIDETYGKGLSNPAFMGQMIIDTPLENRDAISQKLLSGVRVLPLLNKFTRCVETWSKTALGSMS